MGYVLGVSHEVILKKMTEELQKAKQAMAQQKEWQTSIAHIKLLSEILLEEEPKQNSRTVPSLEKVPKSNIDQAPKDDDGTSIFDF